jgi:hypothetical protein
MRRLLPAVVVLAGAATLTACQLPINTSGYSPNGGPQLEGETLTNYGVVPGTYEYSGAGNAVSIAAPANIDNDEREAFWYDGTPMAQDEESCAQWSSAPGITQQGAMLHMTRTIDGGLRGISVHRERVRLVPSGRSTSTPGTAIRSSRSLWWGRATSHRSS